MREKFVTDESQDGGIDAYYKDESTKIFYFIQSKFRTTADNFEEKSISLEELLKMDLARITSGETENEAGISYNGKIKALIRTIATTADISEWEYKVIVLANLSSRYSKTKIQKLLDDFTYEVFDYRKSYTDLVFPVIAGTYYSAPDFYVDINVTSDAALSRIKYNVIAEDLSCEITILFAPTSEMGRIMSTYKNTILMFNPRSYLTLSKNKVNKEIRSTIVDRQSNEFSLFNNGITILSDELNVKDRIGKKGKGQLHLKNPQIINGGQTAYTLSQIYEKDSTSTFFVNKEVLLKIIKLNSGDPKKLKLVKAISRATNLQTPVDEADRRANDPIQIKLQSTIFNDFGMFYERKKGEFFDGENRKYISNQNIVNRDVFIRACYAISGRPDIARAKASKQLFEETAHDELFRELKRKGFDHLYMMLGYKIFNNLLSIEKINRKNKNSVYGSALRYGKYAVVYAAVNTMKSLVSVASIDQDAIENSERLLKRWNKFETFAVKRRTNKAYFKSKPQTGGGFEQDFDNYYKVSNIIADMDTFFKIR